MNLTNSIKEAYDTLPEHKKDTISLVRQYVTGRLVVGLIRVAVVHAIGRKVAPQVFTSLGRSYALALLARVAVKEFKVSDDMKQRIAANKADTLAAEENSRVKFEDVG